MVKVIYMVNLNGWINEFKVEEVEIEKETEKILTIKGNPLYINRLRKVDVGKIKDKIAIAYTKNECLDLALKYMEEKIKTAKELLIKSQLNHKEMQDLYIKEYVGD